MKPVTLGSVAKAVGGALADGDAAALVTGASVDSRSVRGGELFFALQGRVDGADFAPEAHLRGAVAEAGASGARRSGATLKCPKVKLITFRKAGAATTSPQISTCGSSTAIRARYSGFSAGAKPMKEVMYSSL